MTVDLSYDELVLLVQLVNQRFVKLQNDQLQQGVAPSTPFEAALFKKLYDAHMDAMNLFKRTMGPREKGDIASEG